MAATLRDGWTCRSDGHPQRLGGITGGGDPGFGGHCWRGRGRVGSWSGLWYMALVQGSCWLLALVLANGSGTGFGLALTQRLRWAWARAKYFHPWKLGPPSALKRRQPDHSTLCCKISCNVDWIYKRPRDRFFMLSDGRSWCCCGGWCQSALVVSSKRLMGLVDRLVMEHGNGPCQSFVVADAADDVPRSICWQIVDMIS